MFPRIILSPDCAVHNSWVSDFRDEFCIETSPRLTTGLENVTAEKGLVQESPRRSARKHRVTLRLFDQCEKILHRTSKSIPISSRHHQDGATAQTSSQSLVSLKEMYPGHFIS